MIINRGPEFLDAPLAKTPLILAQKVVFGMLLPVPKSFKNVCSTCASTMTGTDVFPAKKTNICNAKFGDSGANKDRGKNLTSKVQLFGIVDPDLPIYYATMNFLSTGSRVLILWGMKFAHSRKIYRSPSTLRL